MLTSEIWEASGYRRPPGQIRVRLMPPGPADALFGSANSLHVHELFDFDLDAAREGRIKRVSVVVNGYIHSGVFAVRTEASERKEAARRNMEGLRAALVADYWNRFRLLRSSRAGRTSASQRKGDRYAANRKLSEPPSVAAIQQLWPGEVEVFDALLPLQAAIEAVEAELAAL